MQLVQQTPVARTILIASPAAHKALEKRLRSPRITVKLVTVADRQAAYRNALDYIESAAAHKRAVDDARVRRIAAAEARAKAEVLVANRDAALPHNVMVNEAVSHSVGVWGGNGLRMDYIQGLSHIDRWDGDGMRARGFDTWKRRRYTQYRANARHNCH